MTRQLWRWLSSRGLLLATPEACEDVQDESVPSNLSGDMRSHKVLLRIDYGIAYILFIDSIYLLYKQQRNLQIACDLLMACSISGKILLSICLLLLFGGFIWPQHLLPSMLCLQQRPINPTQCAFKAENPKTATGAGGNSCGPSKGLNSTERFTFSFIWSALRPRYSFCFTLLEMVY